MLMEGFLWKALTLFSGARMKSDMEVWMRRDFPPV